MGEAFHQFPKVVFMHSTYNTNNMALFTMIACEICCLITNAVRPLLPSNNSGQYLSPLYADFVVSCRSYNTLLVACVTNGMLPCMNIN